jgi:aryl-phospho-beta-D-glucosidase BglC (GH1 family)
VARSSWFTQADVDQLVAAGINTVRIPLGFWIVEPLVDRSIEFYPKGGLGQLVSFFLHKILRFC